LRTHAIRDELTGLPNRASTVEVLDRRMARSVRDRSTLSVVLADVDFLQKINEAHGLAAGDEVPKEAARGLEHPIRRDDSAGRHSGGDFLLVLPTLSRIPASNGCARSMMRCAARPMRLAAGPLPVTCTFAVSILLPDQFYIADQLLELRR